MQVAGEFELEKKRERQRHESRIAELAGDKLALERNNRELKDLNIGLQSQVARLKVDLEDAVSSQDQRTKSLENALMLARFEVAERTEALLSLHEQLASLAGFESTATFADTLQLPDDELDCNHDENGGNGSSAAITAAPSSSAVVSMDRHCIVAGRDALASLVPSLMNIRAACTGPRLQELRAASKAANRWSKETLLQAAEQGDEATVESILSAADHRDGKAGLSVDENGVLSPKSTGTLSAVVASTMSAALRCAIKGGHSGIVKQLLAAGASVAGRSKEDGLLQSVVHVAAAHGHEHLLKLLLSKEGGAATSSPAAAAGLTIDDQDAYRRTPLHLAAAGNHAYVVKYLLLQGADPTVRDSNGLVAIDLAAGTIELSKSAAAQLQQQQQAAKQDSRDGNAARNRTASEGKDADGGSPLSDAQFKGRYYATGELQPNAPAASAAAALRDPHVSFWNASLRVSWIEKANARNLGLVGVISASLPL